MISRRGTRPVALAFSALFGVAGVAHLLRPAGFDAIVPRSLPGSARFWTTSSGVVELALAAGFAVPGTRATSGLLAAGFLLGVWPANGVMARSAWSHRHEDRAAAVRCAVTLVRVPLQVPLVLGALRVHRAGPGSA